MFGPEFEIPQVEHSPENQLIVDRAIDFLAPFFGINILDDEKWDQIDLPRVHIGSGRYDILDNIVYLPLKAMHEGNAEIGHEIGHWYHHVINPLIHEAVNEARDYHVLADYRILAETIADYAAVNYIHWGNPIKDSGFNLLELANRGKDDLTFQQTNGLSDFLIKTLMPLGGVA